MEIYAITMEKNICKELKINLQDTEWKYDYIDHDGNIARAYENSGGIL
ncbi:hypothetical protein [Butyribacter intestini]